VAEVHHFAHGWLNPALAYVMAVLGCLVGLLHATKARTRPGRKRVRLLLFATIGIGGTGIWQMHFIAMLGFSVPDSAVRYEPKLLAGSAGMAILVVGCGLFIAGFGTLRGWRLLCAGVLIGIGIAAMHYTGMAAVRVGGAIMYEPMRFVASVLVAIVAATASLWFVVALRGLAATVLAAMIMGAAISGMHYTAMAAVQVRLGLRHDPIVGVDPMMLVAPIVLLGGAAIAMLAFFTFGASTVRDLRLIYAAEGGEGSEPIEPWMIHEVLARTSAPALPARLGAAPVSHRARRSRIDRSMRNDVVWSGTPVWGTPGRHARAVPARRQSGPSAALTPARYPPNDPGWALPGVIGARAPEYRGNHHPR